MKSPGMFAIALAVLTQVILVAGVSAGDPGAERAGVIPAGGKPIPGQYIVVLKAGHDARAVAAAAGVRPRFVYGSALNGFAAALSSGSLAALQRHPGVAFIEEDQEVGLLATQSNATWGLDRIDQRALPLSTTFSFNNTGVGVRAYVIDTGIRFDHQQFGGRAISGFDAVDGGQADDCNGHGTHVSGTIGGIRYGVAKEATLVAVRVLNCQGSGTNSGVIAGIDWVAANRVKPAVANMSLGGSASTAVDDAVKGMIAADVATAVAAGNGNIIGRPQDACNYSPSRVGAAMTISATRQDDYRASWANYGTCVDGFAPGVNITSAWHTSSTATNTISGTSMATPHVTGVAALYLQGNPNATWQQVGLALGQLATKGVVLDARTPRNHLLYTNF